MKIWAFLVENITPQPAAQYFHGTLAVLARYKQAQKCLQSSQNSSDKLALDFF